MNKNLLFVYMSVRKVGTYFLRPGYVKESLAKRKGECKACGECCRNLLNLNIKCPFLKNDNLCSIHRMKKYLPLLRQFCYLSPAIKEFRDYKKEYKNNRCGYYWDE